MKPSDDAFTKNQREFIIYELNQYIKYYAIQRTIMKLGSFCGYVKNLPIETVDDFAIDVCNTLMEAYKRQHQIN